MNVQELRNYVRAQLDVDGEELPDTILNVYLQDAFERTMAFDNRWPQMESSWDIAKVDGEATIAIPSNVLIPSIMSVVSVGDNVRLQQINHENAEDNFSIYNTVAVGHPVCYSIWDRRIYLWPGLDANGPDYSLRLRAYRQPTWTNGASDIPDLDARCHIALCYYAISLAYAQQEDDVLEAVYLARWERDIRQQLKMLTQPAFHRPLVMFGGAPYGQAPAYVVNLPELP